MRGQQNRTTIQPCEHMPRRTADAMGSNPSLVGIIIAESSSERRRCGRTAECFSYAGVRSLLVDDREGGSGYGQLRGNLRPVAQPADESSGRKLERHNYLIARV